MFADRAKILIRSGKGGTAMSVSGGNFMFQTEVRTAAMEAAAVM